MALRLKVVHDRGLRGVLIRGVFFKSWQFLIVTSAGEDTAGCAGPRRTGALHAGDLATGASNTRPPRRPVGFYSLLSTTQAVFPPEEHVMCRNIRDIAKWLRDITGNIHQSIHLPSPPSLPTQRDHFSRLYLVSLCNCCFKSQSPASYECRMRTERRGEPPAPSPEPGRRAGVRSVLVPEVRANAELVLSDERGRGFPWPPLFFPSEEWIIPVSWCFTHYCFLN